MHLATAVRTLREAHGWTQSELARHAGVTASTIHLIEAGHRGASVGVLRSLASALAVEAGSLIGGHGQRVVCTCPTCAGRGVVERVIPA
jgi:transcriptional regulator with XRE-family HTH domain